MNLQSASRKLVSRKMAPLLLLSVVPAVLGFYLGWRRIASWPRLIAEALIISFVVLTLFLFAFGNPPRQISTRYFLTAVQYWIFSYILFLVLPCIVGEVVGRCIGHSQLTRHIHHN
jgi:hypothetical protein